MKIQEFESSEFLLQQHCPTETHDLSARAEMNAFSSLCLVDIGNDLADPSVTFHKRQNLKEEVKISWQEYSHFTITFSLHKTCLQRF